MSRGVVFLDVKINYRGQDLCSKFIFVGWLVDLFSFIL